MDAHAEPRRGRRPARARAERGHRRDGLRPRRARARDGRAERRADRARRGSPARARRGARRGARRSLDGGHAQQPRVRADRGRTASRPSSSSSPTTRRPRAGCSCRSPRDKGMSLEAQFAAAGLFLARVGRVEDGAGFSSCSAKHKRGYSARDGRRCPAGLAAAGLLALRGRGPEARARERGRARPDRRHRRHGSAHRVGARLRALAGCTPHHFEPKSGHSYIEFGNRVIAFLTILDDARDLDLCARPPTARGAHLLRHARAGAARRVDGALPPESMVGALALLGLDGRARRSRWCSLQSRARVRRARSQVGAVAGLLIGLAACVLLFSRDARDRRRPASGQHGRAPSLVVRARGVLARARDGGVRDLVRARPRVSRAQSRRSRSAAR